MNNELKKFILFLKFELRLSTNTVYSYENDLNKYIIFLKDVKNINNIQSIDYNSIREYIAHLTKNNYKPSSVNRNISSIKKFHLYLFDNEISNSNPSELLESQKSRRHFPNTLSVLEIEQIFDIVKTETFIGVRDLAILSLLYSSGMRVSELINLEFSNLFLEEEYVKIMGKGKKERLVPIGLKAKQNLINYIEKARIRFTDNNSNGCIFLSYRSKPMTRMAIFNLIKKYCLLSGIDKQVSPHTFRHSFATHMLEGGADLRIVQEILGHENINTTEIYTHLDRTYLKEVHKLCHPRG
tara:strand:+ start:4675 stop:5565 length:891 start_codon:yes stop_codon:yes gene_type:complete